MKFGLHTLKNGLRVILVPIKDTETATVMIMTGTGSRYESKEENGMAHFLEHMFFKGTKKRKKPKVILEELDAIGSSHNAFTAKNRTAYYAKVPSKYIDAAVDVISDIFLNSTFPKKEIEKERGTIIQEINMYEDMPARSIHDIFEALIFGEEHSLGRTILGPKKNILSFTREQFIAYQKKAYTAENSVVCVAGKFPEKKILSRIRKDFIEMPIGKMPVFEPKIITQKKPQIKVKYKETDQTHLILGMPAYPLNHESEYALAVLTNILGGMMSSRLFTEIREKRGLAYSVYAWSDAYVDVGYFGIQAGVEHRNLEETVRVITRELRKIKKQGVSAEELRKAKGNVRGKIAFSAETSSSIAGITATSLLLKGEISTPQYELKKLDAVKTSDIKRVANEIFKTPGLNLAVIGPRRNKKKLDTLLRI